LLGILFFFFLRILQLSAKFSEFSANFGLLPLVFFQRSHNIDISIVEKSNKHWEMVKIAKAVSAIPHEEFMNAVFS